MTLNGLNLKKLSTVRNFGKKILRVLFNHLLIQSHCLKVKQSGKLRLKITFSHVFTRVVLVLPPSLCQALRQYTQWELKKAKIRRARLGKGGGGGVSPAPVRFSHFLLQNDFPPPSRSLEQANCRQKRLSPNNNTFRKRLLSPNVSVNCELDRASKI